MGKEKAMEPTEFPLSLEEFATCIPRPESRRAFASLMKAEEETAQRLRKDWQSFYEAFEKQPSAMTWKEYQEYRKEAK